MDKNLYSYILGKKHHIYRGEYPYELSVIYRDAKMPPEERMADRFERLCRAEKPVILEGEQIVFLRTVKNIPDIFTAGEWEDIKSKHFIHELGYISNLSPDYESAIRVGLVAVREKAGANGWRMIDAILELSDRYCDEAERIGRADIAAVLSRVPRYGAENFREALQFFRILHFSLWLEGDYHNTLGRFDQYMWPYLKKDLEDGALDEDSALFLLEDLFLSFNKDSDLYPGVQQGDNGQSMVLGGLLPDGSEGFNLLSKLCLKASFELKMIDPKINLRVSKNTPPEIYELGTELTKAGLGFPQYSNDDVVIPGLVSLGYEPRDAANYVVAACWEFIIPGVGRDIPNISALNFPKVVDAAIREKISSGCTYDELLAGVRDEINTESVRLTGKIQDIFFVPSPFLELLFGEVKYRNFGIHGTGVASAADALAAVRLHIFEKKDVSREELINSLDSDFCGHPEVLHKLRYESPKMGQDDDAADGAASFLLGCFADSLKGKKNCYGGIFRTGTGTAMFYLWHAAKVGATADGRRRGEPFGTNYSPSLYAELPGPVSVIRSFTKQPLMRCINGGPLTLEFAAGTFNGSDSIKKVARLVKYFIGRGGHQLQLNAVDLEAMKDAQLHPDAHRQLVVRVWGWSAYFVELDREYQDHVIARQEYSV